MITADAILNQVRKSPKIPAPSVTVMRVMELTRDPDVDSKQVAEAVSKDAGLTAQLLREANSALYGCTKTTSSVRDACVRLGNQRVRAAVINAHVVDGLGKTKPPGFDTNRYWQTAFATSVAANDLAMQLAPPMAAQASTAGLLCDFGIGLLAYGAPIMYEVVLKKVTVEGPTHIHRYEREDLGITHAQIAAEVLTDWKIDAEIVAAVRAHHDEQIELENDAETRFARIVASAATLAEIAMSGAEMESVDRLFTQAMLLSDEPDALVSRLLDNLVVNIQQTAETMKVELGSTESMRDNFGDLIDGLPDVADRMSFEPMRRSAFDD